MSLPIYRFTIGTSALLVGVSTYHVTGIIREFLINTDQRLARLEEDYKRITDSVERGMNKYAPPKNKV